MKRIVVSRNRYFDSVFLMQMARRMSAQPGIHDASALLATPANKRMLGELGYGADDADFASAGPNDLVIALDGDEGAVAAIAADPQSWLQRDAGVAASASSEARSIGEAVAMRPDASIAVISVPGQYAAHEAHAALEQGLNVFLFSSNVPVVDEIALKTRARHQGLIVMGPDCGTAYIAGAGLGFANAIRRGPIGAVAASGTGLQEFTSLVHRAGSGISHGIGVGSRDLSDDIGGISTFTALDALEADPQTRVIAIIAKQPGSETQGQLVERCARSHKPIVLCMLGAQTIDHAVELALQAAGAQVTVPGAQDIKTLRKLASAMVASMRPGQRHVRGLFAGGTFCHQTQMMFRDAGLVAHSNAPISGFPQLDDPRKSVATTFVDLGAELFVEGRPHPMIDATLRKKRLLDESADPTVALIVLDFVLGANASRDPVGDLLPAIRAAMDVARSRGAQLGFAASVCGTDADAQNLAVQTQALIDAGVQVFSSNAQAAAFAREVALMLAARHQESR